MNNQNRIKGRHYHGLLWGSIGLIPGIMILHVFWFVKLIIILVCFFLISFVITQFTIDQSGIYLGYAFHSWLGLKHFNWQSIESISLEIKSAAVHGVRNPSKVCFRLKSGEMKRILYHPTTKEIDLLRRFAEENNVGISILE